MGTVENVLVAAAARYCGDFAAVEADAHAAEELWFRGRGRFSYCAAEVKPYTETNKTIIINHLKLDQKASWQTSHFFLCVFVQISTFQDKMFPVSLIQPVAHLVRKVLAG